MSTRGIHAVPARSAQTTHGGASCGVRGRPVSPGADWWAGRAWRGGAVRGVRARGGRHACGVRVRGVLAGGVGGAGRPNRAAGYGASVQDDRGVCGVRWPVLPGADR
ncbi:hypothetical protein GCM10027176_22420 [Actinoallomurus bryophytorum]